MMVSSSSSTTSVTHLDGSSLPLPDYGELNIRVINKILTPSGQPLSLTRDVTEKILFDPLLVSTPSDAVTFDRYWDPPTCLSVADELSFFVSHLFLWVPRHFRGVTVSAVIETVDDSTFEGVSRTSSSSGMSESEISMLKKERFEVNNDDDDEEKKMCCVCVEEILGESVITELSPCGHIFHYECIVKWLRKNRTCPICRSKCLVL